MSSADLRAGFFTALKELSFSVNAQNAHSMLKATYEVSDAYSPPAIKELLDGAGDDAVAFTVFDWAFMHGAVRPLIANQGKDVADAFRVLLTACKRHELAAAEGQEIPALTTGQASRLRDALQIIWRTYPQTDPRVAGDRRPAAGGFSAPAP